MMNNKEHLTSQGLRKIVSIRASLNKGLSETLLNHIPDIIPVVKPSVEVYETFYPNWLAGFSSAEGSFFISINNESRYNLGKTIQLS